MIQAFQHWPLLVVLWLASALTVLPFALLPGAALLDLAERPVIAAMSDGLDAWQWIDLIGQFQSSAGDPSAGNPSAGAGPALPGMLQQALFSFGLAGLLLQPLGGLVAAFCYGGVLYSLKSALGPVPLPAINPETGQSPFSGSPTAAHTGEISPAGFGAAARRFARGGWRWFGAFLAMAGLQWLITTFVVVPVVFFGVMLAFQLGWWGTLLILPLLALTLISLAVFEQARVQCVTHDTRNPFTGLGGAFKTLARRPLAWLGLYGLNLLGLLVLHLIFRLGILPTAVSWWPAALLAQQAFIVARLYFRLARLAGGLSLAAPQTLSQSGSPVLVQS